ncbi:MAG: FGGY-family carbohydrate kinase, partial [Thermoplasmatales archaeon]
KEVGYSLKEIRAFGGGSKSDYWLVLKSEILGRQVSRPLVEDTSPFGAAILAMAAKRGSSIHEIVKSLVKEGWIYNPKGTMVGKFQKKYKQYLFLAENLCKLWSEVSKQEVLDDG